MLRVPKNTQQRLKLENENYKTALRKKNPTLFLLGERARLKYTTQGLNEVRERQRRANGASPSYNGSSYGNGETSQDGFRLREVLLYGSNNYNESEDIEDEGDDEEIEIPKGNIERAIYDDDTDIFSAIDEDALLSEDGEGGGDMGGEGPSITSDNFDTLSTPFAFGKVGDKVATINGAYNRVKGAKYDNNGKYIESDHTPIWDTPFNPTQFDGHVIRREKTKWPVR